MKKNIIILHGWGLNGSKYSELEKVLQKKGYEVFAPDLPGFGSEALKSKSMKLDDYVDFVKEYIKKNDIKDIVLIGHSFGGRVCVKFAWMYPAYISKVILTGVPIIRNVTIKKRIAFLVAKSGKIALEKMPFSIKNLFRKILYKSIGEWDYYKSGNLKEVFKNIVNEDLRVYLKQLQHPVYLVWGEEDKFVPVSDIKKIKKLLPGCKSVVITNEGHSLPYKNPEVFYKAIEKFLISN